MTRRISLLDRAFSLARAASSSCSAARGRTPRDDAPSLDDPPCAATRATNHSLRDRPVLFIDELTSFNLPRNGVGLPTRVVRPQLGREHEARDTLAQALAGRLVDASVVAVVDPA